tara:strand:- start:647 stop:847 length:201 start_codon:yes stop_codon:yes gene_type:complete
MDYEQFLFYQLYCLKYPLFAGLAYDQQFSLIAKETEKCKDLLYKSKGNLYEQIQNYLKDCPAISYE